MRHYTMDNGKLYPLYVEFVNAFLAQYPEESIDDVTEYFLYLCDRDEGRDEINMYIVLYEIMKEQA